MAFESCFDIIGPVMVGPSSSHTAGAVSIGRFVHEWLDGCPEKAEITLYGSFAQTYQGHGTDKALIGGLVGMDTEDVRIKHAFDVARQQNLTFSFHLEDRCPYVDHPNTAVISAKKGAVSAKVGGMSIGGGLSSIFLLNDRDVDIHLGTNADLAAICERMKTERR